MTPIESYFTSLRHLIDSAPEPGAAISNLAELIRPLGYSGIDCVVSDHSLLRWGKSLTRHVYLHSGFPKDWDRRWPRYAMVDPVIPALAASLWPLDIHQLKGEMGGSALRNRLWSYMESSGVAFGKAIPVHLPGGGFAGVAFYRPDDDPNDGDGALGDRLFMIGQFFCRALAERFALLPTLAPGQDGRLTEREVECLYWTSVGKTTEEIALIIGRATQTVRFHLENASRKLGAVNRTSAVAQACSRGLITPH